MSSRLRALLVLAPIVAIAGVVLVSTSSGTKPVQAVHHEPATPNEDVRVAPEPSRAAAAALETVTPAPPAKASVAPEPTTEDSLAATMHALEDSDPGRALELARRGQALWPAGPRAPEFAATEVKCLYRLGKPGEGRGAAEAMVNQYPTSTWALEVERQTGAHPHVDH
jgi:hypothetical protein